MMKDELKDLEKRMKYSVEHFRKDLSKIRTGRANISIFEDIKVDYYGAQTPINQLATLSVPDPTLVTIQPYDPNILESLEKSIRDAGLGLNPVNDGKKLKVPIPPLDQERREEIAKHIRKMVEEEKTTIRNMRRETKEKIEEMEKNKEVSEDDKYRGYDKLKELVEEYTKKADELASAKEKEILEV